MITCVYSMTDLINMSITGNDNGVIVKPKCKSESPVPTVPKS